MTRMLTNASDLRFIDVNVDAYKWVDICRDPAEFYIVSLKNERTVKNDRCIGKKCNIVS